MDKDKYFICPVLNGPCSTMTEAEEVEAALRAQLKAAKELIKGAYRVLDAFCYGPYEDIDILLPDWDELYKTYYSKYGGDE